jgi:hypothetical protein
MVFDLSFAEFVTTRVIKVLFVIGVVLAGIYALLFILAGFGTSVGLGIVMLVLSPIVFLLGALWARIMCELIMVIFRIAENTTRMAERDVP